MAWFRTRPSTPGAVHRPERPLLEIQYHPANIRWGVRYLFLTRRQLQAWALGLFCYLLFIGASFAVSPMVARGLYSSRHYRVEIETRELLGERLSALLARLEELKGQTDAARVEMSKIYLAYGFDYRESKGKGGYPYPVAAAEPATVFAEEIRTGRKLEAEIAEQLGVLVSFLEEVRAFEAAHADQVRTTPSIVPLRGSDFVLTSPFGQRQSPFTKTNDFHAGIDLAAIEGTPIHAPADGRVIFAGHYNPQRSVAWSRYGNLVALSHGEHFVTLFGHCKDVKVRAGQTVRQGQEIATVGNTGWSTSSHLHYEVRRKSETKEWVPVDPRLYILDHQWRNEELLLVQARRAPDATDYEPLPPLLGR
ncbi:MAG: M23 family metallopeptidase [Thermoanaerobaculia bacterium]|nr:M23 family metallopeptidase [Thermoanaerobaculia bacterium]